MERFLPRLRMPLAGLWTTLLFLFVSLAAMAQQPFITTWKTNNPGESITIPVNPDVSGYNYTVNWGDGNTSPVQTGDASHTYGAAGTYTVSITGNFPAIHLGLNGIDVTDKLMSVEQWGDMPWASMERAFQGASNMVLNATDVPNLSGVLSLARMFDGASSLNSDLSGWNVSSVTDMSLMFNGASAFNGNISGWNVSNVTNMYGMFWYAGDFNQDIGGWNVSQVADMSYMFYSAADFNQDLSGWVTSNVTNMEGMFSFILGFDQSLGNWDISGVTTMKDMLLATGLSPENYSATLIGWAPRSVQSGVTLDAPSLTYCPGTEVANAIQQLENKGWTINDAGEAADCDGGDIGPADPDHFITVWNTEIDAGTGPYNIKIPATGEFTYTWVNINEPAVTGSGNGSGETIIPFPQPGTYEVRIAPTGSDPFQAIQLHYNFAGNDAAKLLEVRNWGTVHWSKFVFYGCENLKVTATDIPDLSGVTDLSFAFSLSGIDVIPNINDWDVSTVTNLSNLFEGVTGFNQSLDEWDVSNVTDMRFMFDGAASFNQPLDSWDVRKLEDISYMFRDASSFNQSLASWQLESFVGGIASFYMSGMSCENFSYSLYSWATNPNTNDGAILGGSGVTYSPDIAPYVDKLRDERNWRFQLLQEGTCSVVLPDTPIEPDDNNILYVNINVGTDAPGGNGSGDSWQNAIPELADALKWAKENETVWTTDNPLEIWVAAGIYTPLYSPADDNFGHPADRETAFLAVKNVKIYGGFAGGEASSDHRNWAVNPTILSGEIQHDDEMANNAFHVFMVAGDIGVGLLDGVIVEAGSSLDDFGETTTVNGLQFTNRYCGGIYIMNADIRIQNAIIRKNAGESIAALLNENGAPTLINVSIVDNLGDLQGFDSGAVYSGGGGNLKLVNVTIAGNEGYFGGINIVGDGEIRNSIIWGNVYDGEVNADYDFGDAILENNLIEGYTGGGSNINGDPLFTDQTNGDYTLLSGSPAVNAGNNTGYTGVGGDLANDLDLAGNPRVSNHAAGGVIDMGAYEFQEEPMTAITPDANNILYVDITKKDVSGHTPIGDSWANAIPELADALKWAREQHDGGSPDWNEADPLRIFVAKGTYKPLYNAADEQYTTDGGRDNSFVLVPDVQVYGGFDPSTGIVTLEDARILPTMNSLEQGSILSGDFNGNDHTDNYDNHTENAHHVTIAAGDVGSALMDGFTVTGGYASGNTSGPSVMGQTVYRFFGGGTYVVTSSPQFTHMAWFNNLGEWGGGLFNTVSLLTQTSLPKLSNVTFYRNMAPGGGGGIRNFGGSIDINQAVFANNGAGLVEDGTSSGPGGGIHTSGDGTSLAITNATFYGNWIVGVFIPQFDGGALFVEQTSTLLNNVVIWGNEVEGDPADPSASISVSTLGADVTVANSLVAHSGGSANWNNTMGILDGGGNIDTDPLFISNTPGEAGYLRLSACSPAISVGSNQAYIDAGGDLANFDLGGNPRVYNLTGGGVIDMGAYEYQGERVFVQSLTVPDAVEVAYGTALEDVEGLPTAVTATLSNDTDVSIPLDGNLVNWTLTSPTGGAYDGDRAGTYVFAVPLLMPETECYLNPENLEAEVTIVVAKGTPVLTAFWNGTSIDLAEGFSLTYGNVGELALSTTDTDGELTYAFGDDDVQVLDLADLDAVAAQQVGTATLTIAQEETDNYEAASVEIAVTVVPKAITVVAEPDQGKVYGVNEPATYGYELANADALAFDDELMDIVSAVSREAGEDVGAYDIQLVFGGNQAGNYTITFEADNNAFTVTPLTITVTATDKSKVFGFDDPALTYTFAPELIGDDVFIGGLDRAEGENVGSYALTQGNLALGANYEITFEPGTLTITPAAYEGLEFNNGSFVYNGGEHVLELTGELPEGVMVTYEIDSQAGNGATDAGAYEITALIDGGNNYEDAELTATLTITPLGITVTAEDKTKVFGSDDPALTYTFSPELVGNDAFTGELDREVGEAVGTYNITQGNLVLDDNYEVSFVEGTFTITPAAYEGVEFNNGSFVYDGAEHVLELTGELPEGATVSYEIDGEMGNGATDAGAYEITALIDGGNNYEDAELTATLTITPLGITVTAEDKTKVFGSDDPALTYTFSPELVGNDAFTGGLNREEGEDVGSYAITQGNLSLGDSYEISFVEGTFTITPAAYESVEFNNGSFVYNGAEHVLELTGELPEGATVSYEIDGEPGNGAKDAGAYEITALIDGGNNYEDLELTATLTITPLEIRVTAADKTKAFGADDPALTNTFTPALIGDDTFTGGLDREDGENVGNYAITQGNLSLSDNYEISFEEGIFTITPAAYESVEFNNGSFVYDGTEHVLELTGELPEGATVTYEIDGEAGNGATDVGTYEVIAYVDGGANYGDGELTATMTITPAEISGITLNNTSSTYDGTEHRLSLAGDLPAGASVTYEIDSEPDNGATDAGTYEVIAYIDGGANYEDVELTARLTITPLGITVSASDQTKAFGTDDPALTYTFTPVLIGEDVFDGSLARDEGEAVGNYTITQGDLALGGNYSIDFEAGELTITPRQLSEIVFENTSFTYDGTEHTLTLAGDLPAGASVTYENNGRTNVGNQTVRAVIDGGGNYQDEVLDAILTVVPAARALDFPALPEKAYGDAGFDARATASSGEVISYTSSDPDVAEVSADGEITITGAGETTITATVPENANYSSRPQVSQPLTVEKATQTITLDGPAEANRDVGSIELMASSTSGLPVVLTADNNEVATLDGTTLSILRLGRVTITAAQAGDANHEAAEPVTLTIRVIDPTSDLPVRVHPVISPNGDGINEFLMIEAIKDYPENRVTIFNRNGTLLWEASGYDNNRVTFRGISTGQQLLPAGTYFYIVEVKDGNTWKHKKGYFVLRY